MPAWLNQLNWSNWVEIHWDYAWSNQPGIRGRWCPIRPGINYWSNWVEIHWDDAWSNQSNWVVKLGGNPLRWCLIWPIRPDINYWSNWSNWVEIHRDYAWSNWVEIHWDDAQFDQFNQASSQWISTQLDQSSSQWITTQFDQFDQPSSQWKINTKLHNTSEVDSTSKSTSFI